MEYLFAPPQQAQELKDLGFEELCLAFSYVKTEHGFIKDKLYLIDTLEEDIVKNSAHQYYYSRPLYQQAFRWFLDKYNLDSHVNVDVWSSKKCDYRITGGIVGIVVAGANGELFDIDSEYYDTYEEAELECLKRLIKILKEDKDGSL